MTDDRSVALVTGAAHGIGRATAARFAADDTYDLVACLDVEADVEDLEAEYDDCRAYVVDVRDHDAVLETVSEVAAAGPIEAAVNNAAISEYEWLADLEPEDWHRVMDVNLTGQFNVAKAVGPAMYDRGEGYVVNVSSGAGQRGSASGGVHYSASKAGVLGLTKGLAKQLSPHVRVNCVVPGLTDTRLARGSHLWDDDELDAFLETVPMERMATPDEVARVIEFLCTDGAAYVTGSVVDVDGGAALR